MSGMRRPKTRARRRVRMRSALLLMLGACFLAIVTRTTLSLNGLTWLPQGWSALIELLVTLLAFGGGAYLGLCILDGDQRHLVPARRLSREQTLDFVLLGVLAVCPVTLLHEIMMALRGSRYLSVWTGPQIPNAFLAMVVKSALVVPICEELFFRGYLLGALRPYGESRAVWVVSICFALVHVTVLGGDMGWLPLTLLGLLFCLLTLRTGSLLAPMLVHGCYNLTLILLDDSGLSALFIGLTPISCMVRLLGCAAFAGMLKRAYTARGIGGQIVLWDGGRLGKRQIALLVVAAALLMVSFVTCRL